MFNYLYRFVIRPGPRPWLRYVATTTAIAVVLPLSVLSLAPQIFDGLPEGDIGRVIESAVAAEGLPRDIYYRDRSDDNSGAAIIAIGVGPVSMTLVEASSLDTLTGEEWKVLAAKAAGAHVLGHYWYFLLINFLHLMIFFLLMNRLFNFFSGLLKSAEKISSPISLPILALTAITYVNLTTPFGNSVQRLLNERAEQYAFHAGAAPEVFVDALEKSSGYRDHNPSAFTELFYEQPSLNRRKKLVAEWEDTLHRD